MEENANSELSLNQRIANYIGSRIKYKHLVWLFFFINLLNYIERSIISGCSIEMEEFVKQTIHDSPDTFLGLLQSAFIFGFSVACIIFGYCVSIKSPFLIVSMGLSVWFIASMLSGIAWNYWVLLIARLFSGVGEAAFQIVVPAFIDDYSPKTLVGTAMSRLYMAVPVGIALGYAISGFVAEHYSWRIMFLVSAPLMLPFIFILYYYPTSQLEKVHEENINFTEKEDDQDLATKSKLVLKAVGRMLVTPTFLLAVFGEASAVFISIGFNSFSTIFLTNLHMFETETMCALVVGCLGCVSGIIGALLGGYTIDLLLKKRSHSSPLDTYYLHLLLFAVVAITCCVTAALCIGNRTLFLLFVFLGCIAIFATNPSWTLVVLNTAPESIRSLAVGIGTTLYHILGDVPAPILIGGLLDSWVQKAGSDETKRYIAYRSALQCVMLSVVLIGVYWGIGYWLVHRKEKQRELEDSEDPMSPLSPVEEVPSEYDVVVVSQ